MSYEKVINHILDKIILSNSFKINEYDKYVYIKSTPNCYIILCLYIDDLLIMDSNHDVIISTKKY